MNTNELLRQEFPDLLFRYDTYNDLAKLTEEYSKVINITAIRDYENIWVKHIIDSLMPFRFVPQLFKRSASILDLGTGGGFPGLPLAIAFSDCNFTLVDSTRKKLDVVDKLISELKIENAKTFWGRAEMMNSTYKYDIVVARSVAYLPKLLEISMRLIKKGGTLIAYKTFNEEELSYLSNKQNSQIFRYKLGMNEQDRALLCYTI